MVLNTSANGLIQITPIDKPIQENAQDSVQNAHEIAKNHTRREITVADI